MIQLNPAMNTIITPPEYFLDLLKKSRRGKFKIYIGMSAGVGKTYRMLQEAHTLLKSGINIKIGYVETHQRIETAALLDGLPIIPRKKVFYKGRQLEEMDLAGILSASPEVVIVDELAHTNLEGSKNDKRWQDVLEIIQAGISVISAVNIQHIESLNAEVQRIAGVEISERVPDSVIHQADEVVNIDLTADELIVRLQEGKIYAKSKVETALQHFFQPTRILQLRELALREVASLVELKIDRQLLPNAPKLRNEKFLACISTNETNAKNVIRKTARLAAYYNSPWYVLYVQTPTESVQKINLAKQRHLLNNFKLATELGGEVVRVSAPNVSLQIISEAERRHITTICIGKPRLSLLRLILNTGIFQQLLHKLQSSETDLIILS